MIFNNFIITFCKDAVKSFMKEKRHYKIVPLIKDVLYVIFTFLSLSDNTKSSQYL
jgi:hypothetical protein